MRIPFLPFPVLLFFLLAAFGSSALSPGDSLAILVKQVWAYSDPDDLTSRLGPFSYTGNQFVFLEEKDQYPRYYRIITPKGDTAYSLKKNLSGDPDLDRTQLKADIHDKKGAYAPGILQKLVDKLLNWKKWYTYIWLLGWVILLFVFWKYFYLLDITLNNLLKKPEGFIGDRWPVTWSALTGLALGITIVLNAKEAEWFFSEGIRVLAWYPDFWDYLWWGICICFFFLLVSMVVESIHRFGWIHGIFRSVVILIIMNLYVITGLVIGWIIALLLVIYLVLYLLGSSRSSGPSEITYRGVRYVRK